jgi:hypothetical protein
MILALTDNITQSFNMISSAALLATKFDKKFTVCIHTADNEQLEKAGEILNEIAVKPEKINVVTSNSVSISDICEQYEALFLFVHLKIRKRSEIQNILNNCRQLRIPYILFSNDFKHIDLSKIIVPVSFLEEEIEKAQFASAFGRFSNAHIILLQAADYGSKAATTISKMTEIFSKFNFSWETKHARKDSFKVDSEALTLAEQTNAGLIIVSASRDYGLDDIIFGPKEMHLIKKSEIPVMLVNPRGDLYTLCD